MEVKATPLEKPVRDQHCRLGPQEKARWYSVPMCGGRGYTWRRGTCQSGVQGLTS